MVSKNNHQLYQQKAADQKQRWGVRKLSVGVASVLLGTTFLLHSNHAVSANTVASDTTPSTTAQADSKDTVTQGSEHTLRSGAVTPTATAGVEKDTTVTPVQPADNAAKQNNQQAANADTQTNTAQPADKAAATSTNKASDQTTTPAQPAKPAVVQKNVKPVAAPATTTTSPDPTTPDKSSNTVIINDKNNLANEWMNLPQGKMKIYITVKGLDNKIYVSSYADAQKKLKSVLVNNRLDPNSLEFHLMFENIDTKQNIATMFGWEKNVIQVDTSRLGADGIVAYGESGKVYQIGLNHDGGSYDYYERMVELGKDISQVGAFYMTDPIEANDTVSVTIPIKYVGNKNQTTHIFLASYYKGYKGYPGLDLGFTTLHPEQIEIPAKPTTDKDTVTTGIYNNPQITTSDWLKMVHGEAIAYYTAKGKDGKTYVTGYVAANGKSQSIINVKQVDLSILEY
ncbi:YSIRK-type signal peptide-containing protein, partial [Ligilactobacillus saerimneri]|uniref:YSIRK-type signal peptide-containing protein n=1 Tax=Ligilactobacillus saerimneri TaxID=228229 RepID=UPI00242E7851